MNYNNPQLMASVGMPTPQTVIYKSESHKLCQAFPVKEGQTIVQGQPVYLNQDGTISPFFGTGNEIYLGIALTNSEYPAYPPAPAGVEVTVMVDGFAIVYGMSNGEIKAGPVTPDNLPADSQYVYYNQGIENRFIALNTASAKGELIQILVK